MSLKCHHMCLCLCRSHRRNDKVKMALREFTPSNPEAQHLRFLLHGPVGAGKSSMGNSVNTVFQGRTTVNADVAPSTGKSETTTVCRCVCVCVCVCGAGVTMSVC